jgi:hypothetical protein
MEKKMGFKISVTTQYDDAYKDAYFKVGNVRFDPDSKRCRFSLMGWKDQKHREEEAPRLKKATQDGKRVPMDFTATNKANPSLDLRPKDKSKNRKPVTDFDDFFSVKKQNVKDMNISKACYLYARKELEEAGIKFTNVDFD